MWDLLIVLALLGVGLYLLTLIPMDPIMVTIIRVVVILIAALYVLDALGIVKTGMPRLRL